MGLFTKKTYTCRQCGKEYEARINLSGGLCKECSDKREQDRKEISGYLEYGLKTNRDYKEDVWKDIAMHRDGILEKYRDKGSITKEELMAAGENYKKLSEDEATDVYTRALRSCFTLTMGAASTFTFFCPTQYEGVVVDAEDVFAIGYCTSSIDAHATKEAILCAVFTNDPYIPVFAMLHQGDIGLFSLKSKQGRQTIESVYAKMCPNLTYPVSELKQLKKMVKLEGSKGKIDTDSMLRFISDASAGSGLFNVKAMTSSLTPAFRKKLESYGYIPAEEMLRLLRMDSMFGKSFWNKIAAKV